MVIPVLIVVLRFIFFRVRNSAFIKVEKQHVIGIDA